MNILHFYFTFFSFERTSSEVENETAEGVSCYPRHTDMPCYKFGFVCAVQRKANLASIPDSQTGDQW